MPVKSMLVPLVDATAVPCTNGASVPVAATNVCVDEPATAGADSVTEPLVSPEITTEAMIYPYLKNEALFHVPSIGPWFVVPVMYHCINLQAVVVGTVVLFTAIGAGLGVVVPPPPTIA